MIRLENVTKSYSAEVTALRDASFDVAKGEFVSVVGPTGCGKSTLLNVAAGLLAPSSGTVEVFGERLVAADGVNRRAGYMFQADALMPWRTTRTVTAPDIATMAEQGFKNVEAPNWYAMFGPAKLPRPLVERLNDAVRKAIAMPDIRERLISTGADPVLSSPEQLADLLARDLAKWGKLIRDNNITE